VELGLAWRNFAGGTGAAITTWNYDPHRGFLTSKLDANGYGPTYTYTAAGRLLTRTWARTPAITTTYGYNNLGEVVLVDYSDLTPDVSFVFDRRGRQTQVTCNGIVTREMLVILTLKAAFVLGHWTLGLAPNHFQN
jgi:YD repeat-containing protein